jgi:GNAT superfamily N-acetyltransferase
MSDTSSPDLQPGAERKDEMIWRCGEDDFEAIWEIINDGAQAYHGVIPADCWPEDDWTGPYMSREKLRHEIDDGVEFWGYEEDEHLAGVMGLQEVEDVTLIRHAYVRTESQNRGIGAQLLAHLRKLATGPILVGTWADAAWAIRFYEKHGFELMSFEEKNRLLTRYWKIPERQIETSVVLADAAWRRSQSMDQDLPFPEDQKE